jgi:Holliday junction resolvase-like predicted endonuclease
MSNKYKGTIHTNIVLQELKNVSGTDAKTYKFNHLKKFKFKSTNNIIRGYFYSDGVSQSQLEYNVRCYKQLLESNLETQINLTGIDSSTYRLDVVKKNSSSSRVIIYFNYMFGTVGTSGNKGQQYERSMIAKLNREGYTKQTEPDTGMGESDIILNAKGISVGVELKENSGAAFGSATLEYSGNRWRLKSSTKLNADIASILNRNNIMAKVNSQWNVSNKGYSTSDLSKATKELQQVLGEVRTSIDPQDIRDYYKKSKYINIRGKGLFKLQDEDPLNINATLFQPSDCYARVRVQKKSSSDYRFAVELYIGRCPNSIIASGLDGYNLNFLSE